MSFAVHLDGMSRDLLGSAIVCGGVLAAGAIVGEALNEAADRFAGARHREAATVTAIGSGSAEAPPDRATVTVDVTETGPDRSTARDAAADRVEDVRVALEDAEFEDVESAGFQAGRNADTGAVEATHRLTVETVPARAGEAVDVAVDAGVETVRRIQFHHSTGRRMDLRDTAIGRAVADADDEAETVADAAGVHLGDLRTVSANGERRGGARTLAVDTAEGQNTEFDPGPIEVAVEVTATYALERRP
jgi:uncharacterized protein YggE